MTDTDDIALDTTTADATAPKHDFFNKLFTGTGGFEVVGRRKLWFTVTGVILLAAIASIVLKGFTFGIDFEGGTKVSFPREGANGQASVSQVEETFTKAMGVAPQTVVIVGNGATSTVQIRSASPEDAPAIAPHYLSTPEDRQVAADSLRLTRHIVAQPALAKYQPQEFKPGVEYQSDDELARLAGDIASTIFHPVGTTRMGRADDPMAVVNSRLQVRGVAGLRVADAGVMPTITSGNTNSPTLMIAEKAAGWMLQAQQG